MSKMNGKISQHKDAESNTSKTSSMRETVKKHTPDWILAHLNLQDSKLVLRCSLVTIAALVVMLPQNSLQVMGNAAFFALIAAFIIPCAMPTQIFLAAVGTLALGMLFAWAFSCLAMFCSLQARSQVLLQQQIQRQASLGGTGTDLDQQFQRSVFEGVFLDPRSSAVYGVFFAVGAYFFAVIRAYYPKLKLFSIFGTICLDVMHSYGPLFPVQQYTLANTFLIPTAYYIAFGLVGTILIFPQTQGSKFLGGLTGVLAHMTSALKEQDKILSSSPASDAWSEHVTSAGTRRSTLLSTMTGLDDSAPMLNLEFELGRLNAEDLQTLFQRLQRLNLSVLVLNSFPALAARTHEEILQPQARRPRANSKVNTNDAHHLFNERHEDGEKSHMDVGTERMFSLVKQASARLREAAADALGNARDDLSAMNNDRHKKSKGESASSQIKSTEDKLAVLKEALEQFRNHDRLQVLEPFRQFFAKGEMEVNARGRLPFSGRPLFIAHAYSHNLIMFADNLVGFLEHVLELQQHRQQNKVWWPTSLKKLGQALSGPGSHNLDSQGEEVAKSSVNTKKEEQQGANDPDGSKHGSRFLKSFYHAYKWLYTPEAIFSLRYTFLTIALWLPQIFQSSAYFTYANKGLWVLIMAQLGMEIYVSDQIFSYIIRIAGTIAGAIVGMLIWYIAGGGGNPYALAVVFAIFTIPMVYMRIFAPPALLMGVILIAVTAALIVGYSYMDLNLPQLASPGTGWEVAWRRCLLVIIGLTAAAIVGLIPPTSGRKMIRQGYASTLLKLSGLYSHLIEVWLEVPSETYNPSADFKQYLPKFVAVSRKLQALSAAHATAKLEISFEGAWPKEKYDALQKAQTALCYAIIQLTHSVARLDPAWRTRLRHRTLFLNPILISDVFSVLHMTSASLRLVEPLPESLPYLREHSTLDLPRPHIKEDDEKTLTWEEFEDTEFQTFAAAMVHVHWIFREVDEISSITRDLVGSKSLPGFAEWTKKWQ